MSALQANLMLLFQNRFLWFWHFFGALVIFFPLILAPMVDPERGVGYFCGFGVATFWAGMITVSVLKDVMVKPFSFCLPDFTLISKRCLFRVGLVTSAVFSLTLLAYPLTEVSDRLTAVWVAFVAGMGIYLFSVFICLPLNNANYYPVLLVVLFPVTYNDGLQPERARLESMALDHPVAITLVAALIIWLTWNKLWNRSLARKLCQANYLPPHGILNVAKHVAFGKRAKVSGKHRQPSSLARIMENWALGQMQSKGQTASRRFFYGGTYQFFSSILPARGINGVLLFLLSFLGILLLGYYAPHKADKISMASLCLIFMSVCVAYCRITPLTTQLLPASRRDRFRQVIALCLLYGALALTLGVAYTALSQLFDCFFHELVILGKTFTYSPVQWSAIPFFLILMPWSFTCQLLFPRKFILFMILLTSVALSILTVQYEFFFGLSPLGFSLFLLPGCVAAWLAARHCCYSRDLVL